MLTASLPSEAPTGVPVSAWRRIQAGQIATSATGVPRTGVLSWGAIPLVTGTNDLTMTYRVDAFVGAASRDGIGVEFVANDAAETVPTGIAPSANSRIDVIWFRGRFPSLTDAGQTAPALGVTQGTANANPVKPAIPAGAEELAVAVVTSTDVATQTVAITQTARYTVFAGGTVPLRNLAEANAWSPVNGTKAFRLDLGAEMTRFGGQWVATNALDVVTDGNVLAGSAWNGRSPLRTLYLSGSPQVDGSSVTTLAFPGGGFPGGFVLSVKVTLMSAGPGKQAVVSEVTRTGMSIQILTGAGAALPSGTAVPLAVEVIGG